MKESYKVKMHCDSKLFNRCKTYKINYSTKEKNKFHSIKFANQIEKCINLIGSKCYTKIGDLLARGYYSNEPLSFANKTLGDNYKSLSLGYKWARNTFDCMWVNLSGEIDEKINPDDIVFLVDFGAEGLVVDNDGYPMGAVSTSYVENNRLYKTDRKVVYNNGYIKNGLISFWIDFSANNLVNKSCFAKINQMDICLKNEDVINLYYDFVSILDVYNNCDENYCKIIEETIKKLSIFDFTQLDNRMAKQVKDSLSSILLLENKGDMFTYLAEGNCKIDIGYLCPINESYRKAIRAYSSQMDNLNKYYDYIFGATEPHIYNEIKGKYPTFFEQIKEKVASDKWDLLGCSWVEMDSNLISAESLIRQIYYGKSFFIEQFGKDCKVLCLHNNNGFTPSLPQIMKLCNVDYLLTIKTNNKFLLNNTFNWQGLDDSSVLAHFLTEKTCSSEVSTSGMISGMNNYNEKAKSSSAIMLYGKCDGGLGANANNIEKVKRLANLYPLPKVKNCKVETYFNYISEIKDRFDSIKGEIFVENKQGSYSTQYYAKWYNRKIENLLRNYELLVAQIGIKEEDMPISFSKLEDIWKEVLLYQSSKIITGATIDKVYSECYLRYDIIYNNLIYAISELLKFVKHGECLYNPNSFEVNHVYKLNDKWYKIALQPLSFEKKEQGEEIKAYYGLVGDNFIENKMYKITFKNGDIVSLYDKYYNKEFVLEGESMLSYNTYIDNGDAFSINKSYISTKKHLKCTGIETYKNGPIVGARISFSSSKINIEENVYITDGIEGVSVTSRIAFYEKNKMLRVDFETNINSTECTYNSQLGHFKRSTLDETVTQKLQSEVCSHKFVDLSNNSYGISVINDSKFGFRNKGNKISMCLMRCPKNAPNKNIDIGITEVKMLVLPHHANMDINTYKNAYNVNNPVIEFTGIKKVVPKKIVVSNENIIVESVKIAKNGGAIIRLYNPTELDQSSSLIFGRRQGKKVVDLMENVIGEVKGEFTLKPFKLINIWFD